MFQLTTEESESLRSQFATLKTGRGQHRKYQSYVFTEHGADEDLRLRFEALAQLDSTERMVVKELLDGMLLKHQARRLAGVAA